MAREIVILPRFKRDYRSARKHPEFDSDPLPEAFREHRLDKRSTNWAGFTECHLGADLLLIYRIRHDAVILHRIGTHVQLFSPAPRMRPSPRRRKSK